jgi:hypothetical protein
LTLETVNFEQPNVLSERMLFYGQTESAVSEIVLPVWSNKGHSLVGSEMLPQKEIRESCFPLRYSNVTTLIHSLTKPNYMGHIWTNYGIDMVQPMGHIWVVYGFGMAWLPS